jgi:3-methyladenine DNA glycosylase/8-oxoguanine DNA glycosylase
MRRGRGDPTLRLTGTEAWRATATPEGPVTMHLVVDPPTRTVEVDGWGPGATWAVEHARDLVGEDDDTTGFAGLLARVDAPGADFLRTVARRHPGLRIPRSRALAEALVPTVLEQKVIGKDAWASYRALVAGHGSPAPGPGEPALRLPPTPGGLVALPSWEYHRAGIERKRADTLRRVAHVAPRLDEAVDDLPVVRRRLAAIPGVGEWTVAEVARVALGDADAVSVGDFHLPHQVAWCFLGERRGDDALMLELLDPYRPHRGRVLRLVTLSGEGPPRRGPRLARRSIRGL